MEEEIMDKCVGKLSDAIACERAANDNEMLARRIAKRDIDDLITDLSREREWVNTSLKRLEKAIEVDPPSVSEKHKELWKRQAEAMKAFKTVLSERIIDLMDNN